MYRVLDDTHTFWLRPLQDIAPFGRTPCVRFFRYIQEHPWRRTWSKERNKTHEETARKHKKTLSDRPWRSCELSLWKTCENGPSLQAAKVRNHEKIWKIWETWIESLRKFEKVHETSKWWRACENLRKEMRSWMNPWKHRKAFGGIFSRTLVAILV